MTATSDREIRSWLHAEENLSNTNSALTSFHQNRLQLRATIRSLRRSFRDRFLLDSLSPFFSHSVLTISLVSRILSTRDQDERPTRFYSIDRSKSHCQRERLVCRHNFLELRSDLLQEYCHF